MYKINSEYNKCCYFLNICISGNTKTYVETHNDLFCPQNACSEIWLMDRKGNKFISMICKLSGNLTANAGFKRDYEIGPCMIAKRVTIEFMIMANSRATLHL